MMHVRSKYIDPKNHEYVFYVRNFRPVIEYFYLANNQNKYYLILTEEIEYDIEKLDKILTTKKKNPEFNRVNIKCVGTKPVHKDWCEKYSFEYEEYSEKIDKLINLPEYVPKKVDRPRWAYPKDAILFDYFRGPDFRILHMEGLDSNWDILKYLRNDIYAFIMMGSMFAKWNFEYQRNTIFTVNPELDLSNLIWETPDMDTMLWATEYGFDYVFCNHNCWLDWNKFTIREMDKEFDMVMNARPERNFKRPYLAKQVPRLAYIKGRSFRTDDVFDYKELNAKFVNEERIPPERVMEIYNQSYCGGIFSAAEGACYSSSEYLLCGLPVISTMSRGGRDTWYTPENTLIVEPTEEAVVAAVEKIKSMNIDRQKIRDDHIKLSQEMRNEYNRRIQLIFDMHNVNMDASEYFEKVFIHKMKQFVPIATADTYFK